MVLQSRFSRISVLIATVAIVMMAQAESEPDPSTVQPESVTSQESTLTEQLSSFNEGYMAGYEAGYMAGFAAGAASCTVCSVPSPEAVNFMYHANQRARCNQTTGTAPTTPAQEIPETSPGICSSGMAIACVDEFVQMGGCAEGFGNTSYIPVDCDAFGECAFLRCCLPSVACVDGFVLNGGCQDFENQNLIPVGCQESNATGAFRSCAAHRCFPQPLSTTESFQTSTLGGALSETPISTPATLTLTEPGLINVVYVGSNYRPCVSNDTPNGTAPDPNLFFDSEQCLPTAPYTRCSMDMEIRFFFDAEVKSFTPTLPPVGQINILINNNDNKIVVVQIPNEGGLGRCTDAQANVIDQSYQVNGFPPSPFTLNIPANK